MIPAIGNKLEITKYNRSISVL